MYVKRSAVAKHLLQNGDDIQGVFFFFRSYGMVRPLTDP
jgi:hypothetical protein